MLPRFNDERILRNVESLGASIAAVMAQIPKYMQLIAAHKVEVPTQTYPLSSISEAWTAPADATRRTVIVP